MNEQAQRDFSKVIELHPNWPGAYLGRANAWINLGDANKATADYREAANLDPGSTEELIIHRLVVEAHHHISRKITKRPLPRLRKRWNSITTACRHYATRTASYWYAEQFVEATDDYSQLLELAPDAAFAYVGRGQVYVELGEYETALVDLNQAVEMERQSDSQSGLAYALCGRDLAYAGLQQFEAAQRDFDESIHLRPNNAWVHYNRGLMFRMLDKLTQATEAFQHALTLDDPPLTKRKRERARAFLQQNR